MANIVKTANTVGQVDTGGSSWSNPNNISINDTTSATCDGSAKNATCDAIVPYNFIAPNNAIDNNDLTITGIEFSIRRFYSGNSARDLTISLAEINGSQFNLLGINKASANSYNTVASNEIYGGVNDTWGLTQQELQTLVNSINNVNPNLGLYILPQVDRSTVSIEYVECRIYYNVHKCFVYKNDKWVEGNLNVYSNSNWSNVNMAVFNSKEFISIEKD